MKISNEKKHRRIAVLFVMLFSVITFTVLPMGVAGSVYILSVAAFSGLVAALIFVHNSVREIKAMAEEMSEKDQAYNLPS